MITGPGCNWVVSDKFRSRCLCVRFLVVWIVTSADVFEINGCDRISRTLKVPGLEWEKCKDHSWTWYSVCNQSLTDGWLVHSAQRLECGLWLHVRTIVGLLAYKLYVIYICHMIKYLTFQKLLKLVINLVSLDLVTKCIYDHMRQLLRQGNATSSAHW